MANRFVKVRDDGTVFDFTADGNVATFDEGADLIDLDGDGDIDRIIVTVTDNGVGDFDPRVNVIRDPGTLVYNPVPTTDLKVSITNGQSTYIPGSQLTYTVTVINAGPSLVSGAMVDVPLPVGAIRSSWTATVGGTVVASGTGAIRRAVDLASNASAVFTVVAEVSRTTTAGLAALATVSAPDGTDETNPDDNAALDTDTVLVPTSIVLGSDVGCLSMSVVRVLDLQTGAIREFTPYESRFIGGIRVATADLTGDGIDEIVVAPGRAAEIRVFTQWGYELEQYRTIAFPGFTGGVELGLGDVTGDGVADIAVSMAGGRSEVRIYQVNPWNLADPVADRPILAFQPFGPRFAGGVSVALADVGRFENGVTRDVTAGDGRRELIVASGAGMSATVQVYDLSGARPRLVDTINPFRGSSSVGMLTLSAGRFDADTVDDIIVSSGQGGRSALEIYSGRVDDRQDLRLLSLAPFAAAAQRNAAVSAVGIDVDQDGRIDFLAAGQGVGASAGMLRPISVTGTLLSQAAFAQSLPPTPLRVAGLNNRPLPAAVTGRNAWLSSLVGQGSLSAQQAAFAAIGTALAGVNADGARLIDRR